MASHALPSRKQVQEALEMYLRGDSWNKIGRRFGRSSTWVANISLRERWPSRRPKLTLTMRCPECFAHYKRDVPMGEPIYAPHRCKGSVIAQRNLKLYSERDSNGEAAA